MSRRTAVLLVLLLTVGWLPAPEVPWLGKKVMPGRAGVRLRQLDASGEVVEVAPTAPVYAVAELKGAGARLVARGQSGWATRAEWVLLADAAAHYSEMIRADPS